VVNRADQHGRVQKLLRDGAVRMPTAGETARAAQAATPVKGGTAALVAPTVPAAVTSRQGDDKSELRGVLEELRELRRRLSRALV
jgi:phage-related tail fiber protein